MTERLYYDQSYLTEFDAAVTAVQLKDGRTQAALDRSAFYPTSGGQPFDTGTLNGLAVTDVYVDAEGEVWHQVEGALSVGDKVHGSIDWARRFDHMQQHAGEHMLAGAVYRQLGGNTIGLHLGAEFSTIDITMPDGATHLTPAQVEALEKDVNEEIYRNVPIRCWFPEEAELNALPLRKPPTVKEHVRIVAIGEREMVACGGTHPKSAGEIGMVKIIDARPSKGKMRLAFVCGMRALKDYQLRMIASDEAAALLSAPVEQLPEAVKRMQENIISLKQEMNALRREQALSQAQELMRSAQKWGEALLIAGTLPALLPDALRELATGLMREAQAVVLLATPRENGGYHLLFARSEGVNCDAGKLLKAACAACGGKGGGKPDFAQGSAPTDAVIAEAKRMLMER